MKLTLEHAGCWFDGVRGVYIGAAVQCCAQAAGWTGEPILSPYSSDYWEATEEAEQYLSELAPVGYWVGFFDGDFGMWEADND